MASVKYLKQVFRNLERKNRELSQYYFPEQKYVPGKKTYIPISDKEELKVAIRVNQIDLHFNPTKEYHARLKKNLTDKEVISLALYLVTKQRYDRDPQIIVFWEIRLLLEEYCYKTQNPCGFMLFMNKYQAKIWLADQNQNTLRVLGQNLISALRKIDIVNQNEKVKKPQRKRGYTDQGSMAPYEEKIRKAARNSEEDYRLQRDKFLKEKYFQDALGFLSGYYS